MPCPIKGKPLLQIWLELLQKHGITQVLINMDTHVEAVRTFLAGRFSALETKLVEESRLLGHEPNRARRRVHREA